MYLPQAKPARAGMQTGLVVYAALKRVPRAASASRFGVWMTGWPALPSTFGLCSSDMMTRTFFAFIALILSQCPMSKPPFHFVPLPKERSAGKPRKSGRTMIIDDGMPLAYVRDLVALGGAYMDLAKIKTGTARLYPRAQLVQKLKFYKRNRIQPFLGGQFHEYVFATQGAKALPKYYAESVSLGFEAIEISDNVVPLTDAQRREQIRNAVRAGLIVYGEVGSKETLSNPALLIRQARLCFDAGAAL